MTCARTEAHAGSAAILVAAARSLESCAEFLEGLDAHGYTRASARLFNSTIGQHVRHSVDHFVAVADSLDGAVINYDKRQRETPIEHDCATARDAIRALAARLEILTGDELAAPVRVRIMISSEGNEAELGSTFGRELAFATHHATHHFAMIASLAGEMDLAVPEGFGKAPSTVHHQRSIGKSSGR